VAKSVAVVGAGISGVTAARVLQDGGLHVVVLDRGQRIGGRMAVRTLRGTGLPYDGRPVDVGAAFVTADDPAFLEVVAAWLDAGLARTWTDTFHVAGAEGITGTTSGPMRYGTPGGLRSLVEDLAVDLTTLVHPRGVDGVEPVDDGVLVDGERFDAVVLAMPDPQARDVLPDDHALQEQLAEVAWLPVLSLTAAYSARRWRDDLDAVFVNDLDALAFVADDGRRRGDGAPVLVAHAHAALAAQHLDDPSGAAPMLIDALRDLLDIPAPAWHEVRRWSLARPQTHREQPFGLSGRIGVCGDAWGARPRVQTAWKSGSYLGAHLGLSGI
jgi:renalase